MDPICHTLVGATLSRTGLETKTRYAAATLIIAANLPDIDVVAHAMGATASYAYRRGITHGIPALIILPVLLAAAVWLFGRNRGGGAQGPPVSFKGLLLLSAIGVVSHPILDWMNTYGMRWLMPIVDRWYYGDTLFIIDWIAWLILAVGLTFAIVQKKTPLAWYRRPANLALTALIVYIGVNYGITQNAERAAYAALSAKPPARLLASPVPFNPLRREIVLDYKLGYRFGSYRAFTAEPLELSNRIVPKGDPEHLQLAQQTLDGQRFLHWARFPYSVTVSDGGKTRIVLADARYVPDIENPRLDGFAMLELEPATDRTEDE